MGKWNSIPLMIHCFQASFHPKYRLPVGPRNMRLMIHLFPTVLNQSINWFLIFSVRNIDVTDINGISFMIELYDPPKASNLSGATKTHRSLHAVLPLFTSFLLTDAVHLRNERISPASQDIPRFWDNTTDRNHKLDWKAIVNYSLWNSLVSSYYTVYEMNLLARISQMSQFFPGLDRK